MDKHLTIDINPLQGNISVTRQLSAYLPEIERNLAQGIRRQVILDHLNKTGFNLTMNSFETMLKRLRKRSRPTPALGVQAADQNASLALINATGRKLTAKPNIPVAKNTDKYVNHDLTKLSDW